MVCLPWRVAFDNIFPLADRSEKSLSLPLRTHGIAHPGISPRESLSKRAMDLNKIISHVTFEWRKRNTLLESKF